MARVPLDHVMRFDVLRQVVNGLVDRLLEMESLEIPKWRFDGEELTRPEDVAAAMGIPVTEARARLAVEGKDVYSLAANHPVTIGVGSVLQRRGGKRNVIQDRAIELTYRRGRRRKRRGNDR